MEGALGRRQDCARQEYEPGPLRRCLLHETFNDTNYLARASLPRRLPGLVVIARIGLGLEAPNCTMVA